MLYGKKDGLYFVVILCLASTVFVSPVVGFSLGVSDGLGQTSTGEIEPDSVGINVELSTDGTANWSIEYRVSLSDSKAAEGFASLEQDIGENPEQYLGEFSSGIEATVERAESSTGREMSAEGFSVDTEVRQIPSEYGIVTYSFRWEGFVTEGDGYRAFDAIDSFFLDEDSKMIVSWDGGLKPDTVLPTPTEERESSLVWSGPIDFASGEPRVELSEEGATRGTEGDTPEGGGDGLPVFVVPGVGFLLALSVASVYALFRRKSGSDEGMSGSVGGSDTYSGSEENEELLSNEERVLRLVREEGGRIKQKQITEELGWTDAKTSQVVGSLKDGDEVEVYRLGRENVLKLTDENSI